MNRCRSIIVLIAAVLLVAGCGRQAPQRPSQRLGQSPQPDSAQLALMELNHRLAEAADEELHALAVAQEEPYALYEGNVWAWVMDRGDTDSPAIREKETCSLHMRIYSLDGTLLSDTQGTYTIGQRQLPQAVEANITEWHHRTRVRMFAPWYAAYGLRGNEAVPPYENVIIELTIE